MATKYCKHLGGGKFDPRLFAAQGADCYPYEDTAPTVTDAQSCFCTGFKWLVEGETATGVYKVVEVEHSPESVVKYSVVSIIEHLRAKGVFDQFREMLVAAKYDWDFIGANYLASNHPTFAAAVDMIVGAGLLTREQVAEMLADCIWSPE